MEFENATINSVQAQSQRRFRYQGGNVREALNFAWAGKTMDEVVPGFVPDFALDVADECALSGCAIYAVFSTWDTAGHQVDCERLLLPFGQDGIMVEQIVASLQLKSLEGEIEGETFSNGFSSVPS